MPVPKQSKPVKPAKPAAPAKATKPAAPQTKPAAPQTKAAKAPATDAHTPGDVAQHLLDAGVEELAAAAELLTTDGTTRSMKRALSEAARGIELVLKAILATVHWTLIFDDPAQASLAKLMAGDFKSVSVDECLDRLARLEDFKLEERARGRLKTLRTRRNRFEHFGSTENIHALRGAMGAALHVLTDVLGAAEEDGLLPAGRDGACTALARQLVEFDRFSDARMQDLRARLNGEEAFSCPQCFQLAALQAKGLNCLFCKTHTAPETAADHYVENTLNVSRYETLKDGGTWPVFGCPECGEEALVQLPPEDGTKDKRGFICFGCGEDWKRGSLQPCWRCSRMVRAGDAAICSQCFSDEMEKD